jgi:hypothetical protein
MHDEQWTKNVEVDGSVGTFPQTPDVPEKNPHRTNENIASHLFLERLEIMMRTLFYSQHVMDMRGDSSICHQQ